MLEYTPFDEDALVHGPTAEKDNENSLGTLAFEQAELMFDNDWGPISACYVLVLAVTSQAELDGREDPRPCQMWARYRTSITTTGPAQDLPASLRPCTVSQERTSKGRSAYSNAKRAFSLSKGRAIEL